MRVLYSYLRNNVVMVALVRSDSPILLHFNTAAATKQERHCYLTPHFFQAESGSTSLSPNISLDVSTYSAFVRVIVFCFYQHSLENTVFGSRRSHENNFHPHYVLPAARKKVFTANRQAGSSRHKITFKFKIKENTWISNNQV